ILSHSLSSLIILWFSFHSYVPLRSLHSFPTRRSSDLLRSALDALRVPIESQMVVFSKTSVQAQRINPQNPRTLFFNDSVVIGWVRGGFIEVAAQDPRQGVIF